MFFTYEVECGAAPLVQLSVPRTWARQVAGAGWAVVDGLPVVDVVTWDHGVTPARPARVRTVLICAGYYDAGMHGWRAHADNRICRVAWTEAGAASLVMPWGQPSGRCPTRCAPSCRGARAHPPGTAETAW
ncbi:hypothetical protein [Streptomyces sp. NPDC085540]|uniref:hypothetical protein n=1 Tax=Streptomyces sp. NPDC085540 TaxID=3365730 RepID=UPI0037D35174